MNSKGLSFPLWFISDRWMNEDISESDTFKSITQALIKVRNSININWIVNKTQILLVELTKTLGIQEKNEP